MALRLKGKVALISGGTRGIGFGIAERLGLEGCKVVICSRKKKNVDDAVKQLKAKGVDVTGLVCHVGTEEERKKLIEATVNECKQIDILVSNVAVSTTFGPMLETTTESAWDKVFDVNVKSHFFLIKGAVPHMPANSSIIIISSYTGYKPSPMIGPYAVSKTALIGLTRALATELAPKKIRVNCLAPGVIQTSFSEALWKAPDVAEISLRDIPMNRFGTVEDCAGVVAFLASADSAYVTGETILATGGIHARL